MAHGTSSSAYLIKVNKSSMTAKPASALSPSHCGITKKCTALGSREQQDEPQQQHRTGWDAARLKQLQQPTFFCCWIHGAIASKLTAAASANWQQRPSWLADPSQGCVKDLGVDRHEVKETGRIKHKKKYNSKRRRKKYMHQQRQIFQEQRQML